MRILVDGDSLSPRLRGIIARAAARHRVVAVFVANRAIPVAEADGALPGAVQTTVAPDADEWLAAEACQGDLAVTRDLPLAARLVARGVEVVTDRGEHYTQENIAARLSERDATMRFREAGVLPNRGAARRHGTRETHAFAAALDRVLTARCRHG